MNQSHIFPIHHYGEELWGISIPKRYSWAPQAFFSNCQGQTEQLILPRSKFRAWMNRDIKLKSRHSLEGSCCSPLSHTVYLPLVLAGSSFVTISGLFRQISSHLCLKSLRLWLAIVLGFGNSPAFLPCCSLFSSPCWSVWVILYQYLRRRRDPPLCSVCILTWKPVCVHWLIG